MCVNPLRIPNKGYRPYSVYTPPFIDAPCGHCWQCKLTRQNDYSFRVLHDLLSHNCVPFFVTLTYNDYYLPRLTYVRSYNQCDLPTRLHSIPNLVTLSVWNKQHVQRFNKRLRRQISYYYGVDSSAFKYLVTCERGSNDEYLDNFGRKRVATERPHYHCMYLLFVPQVPLPVRKLPSKFYDFCRVSNLTPDFVSFFKFLLSSRWIYGNIDDVSFCRDVVSATRYVTKYISKDINENLFSVTPDMIQQFYDNEFNDRYKLADLKHSLGVSYRGSRYPKMVELKDLFPRSFSSINLGMSFIENKSYDELLDYCSGVRKVCLPSQKSASLIMIPLYYVRKLTRFTKKCRVGSYSQRYVFTGTGFVFRCKRNLRKLPPLLKWNNLTGAWLDTNHKTSYTETLLSDFGKLVLRRRLLGSYKRFRNSVFRFFSHRSYYDSVLNSYFSVRPDAPLKGFGSVVLSPSLCSGNLMTGFVRNYFSVHKDSAFNDVSNFIKLCNTAEMTLKHLAFEKQYANNLVRTAYDNPDLFLSHYL